MVETRQHERRAVRGGWEEEANHVVLVAVPHEMGRRHVVVLVRGGKTTWRGRQG